MSFGYSVGDFMLLTQLAYRVVQNARKACGAHHDLAREIGGLHIVLGRVEVEVSKPDSILNNNEDNRRRELEKLARHCERVLNVLEHILDNYNALSDERISVTKLWQKVKFGNGEMLDLGKIRAELATHTQALNLFLNLLSIGTQGKVEKYMDSHGEELRDIKHSLHWVTSSMQAKSHEEKSILTTYGDDDKAIWKAFRRELIEEGFSGRLLDRHKSTIKNYVMELGARGALDEPIQHTREEDIQTQSMPPPERPNTPVFLDSSSGSDELTDSEAEDERADQDSLTQLEGNISNISNYINKSYKPPLQAGQLLYEAHGEAPPQLSTRKPCSKFRATVEDVEDEEVANSARLYARLYHNDTSNGTETISEETSLEPLLYTNRDDTDLKEDDEDESQTSEYQEWRWTDEKKTVPYLPLGKDPEGRIYPTNLHPNELPWGLHYYDFKSPHSMLDTAASMEKINWTDYPVYPESSAPATCSSASSKSEPDSFQRLRENIYP
ncbi:hypothetical protein LARI1_G007596 [Lachnellula arida]|uniref:Fungal N-terminal domain-containing protein n=1 Tax=Lachnellula arida TaxID=1316785 RepID=A0A8T9B662_9HELO|nr:hypothetical protein LARI1_G007596 [Lachnellula arida]